MTRTIGTITAVVVGAVVGAVITLSLPAPTRPLEPGGSSGRRPGLRETPIRTVLVWTPARLPEGFAEAVGHLEEVRAVTEVRSGVAWLTSWRDAGGPIQRPPSGLLVPVEVAAIDATTYERFVPPADRGAFVSLVARDAFVGRMGAALRGVGAGGYLSFGKRTFRVQSVVDDELLGDHEVVVSSRMGERIGISRPRYLLVAPAPGVSRRNIETAIRRVLPGGVRVRVRGPGETPVFRHGDAVLSPVRLKELFGEFAARPGPGGTIVADPGWVEENIRSAAVPILGMVRCHRKVLSQLRGALEELARRGLGDLIDPGDYGGCFSPRFANRDPTAGLSHHSWGVAVDVNVTENPLGGEPRLDRQVVEVFERWGFTWGGRWLVPDGMHFEFLRFPLAPRD